MKNIHYTILADRFSLYIGEGGTSSCGYLLPHKIGEQAGELATLISLQVSERRHVNGDVGKCENFDR